MHILALVDSYSALDWMYNASCDLIKEKLHNTVAIWLGWTIISNEELLHSQYIKGTSKIIQDLIYRDFHNLDESLTQIFNPLLPLQIAESFRVKPFPE